MYISDNLSGGRFVSSKISRFIQPNNSSVTADGSTSLYLRIPICYRNDSNPHSLQTARMTADTGQQSLAFRYPVAAVQKNMVLVTKNKSTQTTEGIRKECTGVPYLLSFPQKHIPLSSQVGPHIRLIGCESQAKRARLPITYGRKISKFGLVKEKRFLLSRLHRMGGMMETLVHSW